MMRRQRCAAVLLTALLLVGCKEMTPVVNLGAFGARMPGTLVQETVQIPTNAMGLGDNVPLVMQTTQSQAKSDEIFIAISLDWSQVLLLLKQKRGPQWNTKEFTDLVEQSVIEMMVAGAAVGDSRAVRYGGQDGNAMAFTLTQTPDGGVADWKQTRGEVVSFVSESRLIMLFYATEQSAFSERNKEQFFSSLVVYQP